MISLIGSEPAASRRTMIDDNGETMPTLLIQSGRRQGRQLRLGEGEFLIGRHHDCRIRLASVDIIRRYLQETGAQLDF